MYNVKCDAWQGNAAPRGIAGRGAGQSGLTAGLRGRAGSMRLLVTGVSGLIGSNVAAAAAQQSWSVVGTWRDAPVSLLGARTAQLDVGDRHACVALAEEFEPDVIVHAAAEGSPGRLGREPATGRGRPARRREHARRRARRARPLRAGLLRPRLQRAAALGGVLGGGGPRRANHAR